MNATPRSARRSLPAPHRAPWRAFTVLELMITVALIAILAIATLPFLSGFSSQTEPLQGLNDTAAFFERARLQAAQTGLAHRVQFQRGINTFQLDRAASASCCCSGAPDDPFSTTNGATHGVATFDLTRESPTLVVRASDPTMLFSGTDHVCVTPDGRVLSTVTGLPFEPSAWNFGAGTAAFEIEQQQLSFGGPRPVPNGTAIPGKVWRVIVSYSGLGHWEAR